MWDECIKSKDYWKTIAILAGFSALAIGLVFFIEWLKCPN